MTTTADGSPIGALFADHPPRGVTEDFGASKETPPCYDGLAKLQAAQNGVVVAEVELSLSSRTSRRALRDPL